MFAAWRAEEVSPMKVLSFNLSVVCLNVYICSKAPELPCFFQVFDRLKLLVAARLVLDHCVNKLVGGV